MPPKAATRGRKRAPPPVASDASQPEPPALPQDVNEELSFGDQIQSTPKPRGRPPKNKKVAQLAAAPESQPRRRRPPSAQDEQPSASIPVNKDDELADESVDTPGTASRGQRTGVLSDSLQETAEEEAVEDGARKQDGQGRKRKRGRPARAEAAEDPTEQEVEPRESQAPKKRKRGRPSAQQAEAAQDEPSDARPQRKRKQAPSTTEDPSAVEPDPPTKKPRGRPRKSDLPPPSDPPSQPRPRGRPRTSNVSASHADETQPSKTKGKTSRPSLDASTSHPASRKRTENNSSNPVAPSKPSVKYRHIGTKPASIPRSKIEATWSPLPAASIAIATSLIHLAERPVLQHLATNTKRRDHAAFALRTVSHNLARKLARNFPFPPAAAGSAARTRSSAASRRDADPRDEELDYERCLDAVKALERTQTGLLHGNALLRAEVAREEAALEKEYAELDALEANARSETRRLREDMRKTHPLVPDRARAADVAAAPRPPEDTLRVADAPPAGLIQDLDVPGLEGLGARVGSHMESLRANLHPVEDVIPEIARSRAALRDVLSQHLEPQQFQEVLLG